MQDNGNDIEPIWLEAAQAWDKLSEESGSEAHIKAFRNSQGIGENAF